MQGIFIKRIFKILKLITNLFWWLNSFFVLGAYLNRVGAYWYGYWSGYLGFPLGLDLLVGEMIMIGLSIIPVLAIHKLSIRLTEIWLGEEELFIQEF